jgi:hypothetical protein
MPSGGDGTDARDQRSALRRLGRLQPALVTYPLEVFMHVLERAPELGQQSLGPGRVMALGLEVRDDFLLPCDPLLALADMAFGLSQMIFALW